MSYVSIQWICDKARLITGQICANLQYLVFDKHCFILF